MKLSLFAQIRQSRCPVLRAGVASQKTHIPGLMKKLTINVCCALAVAALAQSAQAQWTYVSGNINNTNFTYDGTGVDSALDPRTQGAANSSCFVGVGGIGSLTVQSGSLTLQGTDFKIGRNANSTGTVSVVSGTLNINLITAFGGGVGVNNNNNNGSLGTVNIASGATFNWFLSGSTEQSLRVGNGGGGANGVNTRGIINLNGGTFNLTLDPAQALTDVNRAFTVGQGNGTGTLNLNSGTLNVIGDLPIAVGGGWTLMTTTPTFADNGVGRINILDGALVQTNVTPAIDASKATFQVGAADYVSFTFGGTGQLSLVNWTQADYEALVNAGQIRVNSNTTTIASFVFSTSGGQGILKVGDPVATTPSISPSNSAYAGEIVILSETPFGTAPFSYQWQWDNGTGGATFSEISGATSQSYTQDTTGLLGNYQYRVVLTNGLGNANTSSVATLTVNAATIPFIATDTTPATVTLYVGGTVTFSAAFDGNHPIAYQWQADTGSGFTNIPGATSTSLTLSNLQFAAAGNYQLTATNSVGGSASTPAALTILDPAGLQFTWSAPVPFGGLNADQILTNVSGGATGVVGAAVFGTTAPLAVLLSSGHIVTFKNDGSTATSTGGGPAAGAYPGGTTNTTGNANFNSVLNQFRSDQGPKTITLNNLIVGEQYAVQLFALDDRAATSNRLSNFQDGDDAAISVETSATFAMGANAYVIGTFYASNSTETIRQNLPTGNNGNMNALVLRALSFTPVTQPPVVTVDPQSKSAFAAYPVQFSIVAESYVAPTYQWRAGPAGGPYTNLGNGGVYSGVTTTNLTISSATGLNGTEFVNVVSNPAGSTPSNPALLTVLPIPPGTGTGASAVLALNPMAYWPLNETNDPSAGGQGAFEAIAGRHGTYRPAAQNAFYGIVGPQGTDGYPQFADGQGALQGAGSSTDSWVETPALNLNTNTVTITLWVNPNGTQFGFSGLLMNRNPGQAGGLHFRDNNELGYTWVTDDSTQWGHLTGLFVPANQWSFCALVVTPTNTTWYLYNTSGLQTHTYTINNPVMPWTGSSSLIRIGSDSAQPTRVVNGRIDEVAVFNRSLSQSEIMQIATASPTLTIQRVGTQLQVAWPFGTLLEATDLNGPWTTNATTSPYMFTPSGAQKFFRAKTP